MDPVGAARIAGANPLIRPTIIGMDAVTVTRRADRSRWMSETPEVSSSSSDRNGIGVSAHSRSAEMATPTAPPVIGEDHDGIDTERPLGVRGGRA